MPTVSIQNDVQSKLNDRLTEYLKFVDKEREEIKRQQVAIRYAHKQTALYAAAAEQRRSQGFLAQRLNAFRADRKSPLRSRLPFPMALQSYLRA